MNKFMDKLVHKTKSAISSTSAQLKERFYTLTGTSSATVIQIAEYVRNHSDTKVMKKELLGRTYYFYDLKVDGIFYHLETKSDYILQLDVQFENKQIVAYRSYRDQYSLYIPIKFPELI
ncbi:hypothetical protein [Cytobacillus dafuensis]|uniref:Uncharacterized protein n=1 Tax=Cytobacillus dafuensis TaxID=1742359 RepID=A0A5B8Z436_CYTDA|nr:hypothetical protein [Cytobacillus dafuensis]QED47825.1 hypothetical protein FSZ17_11505 [Cytobacillus dafuensis]